MWKYSHIQNHRRPSGFLLVLGLLGKFALGHGSWLHFQVLAVTGRNSEQWKSSFCQKIVLSYMVPISFYLFYQSTISCFSVPSSFSLLNCTHRTYNWECWISSFHIFTILSTPQISGNCACCCPQSKIQIKMNNLEGDILAFRSCHLSPRCLPRDKPSVFIDKSHIGNGQNSSKRVVLATQRLLFILPK